MHTEVEAGSGIGSPSRRGYAAVLCCDIVGHSSVDSHDVMVARVRGISEVIVKALAKQPLDDVLWLPGGDGGHVLFLSESWVEVLFELLGTLWQWAEHEAVPLRIAAHHGPVEVINIKGPRGGPSPVGEAINTATSILTRGSAAGIVVSEEFRKAVGSARAGVTFHDQRDLRLKHGRPHLLYLMSLTDRSRRSQWMGPVEVDQERLVDAVKDGRGFDAVYYAKRLLQVNSVDGVVTQALARVDPLHFRYRTSRNVETINAVLGHLDQKSLRRTVELGQLVERGYNEIICRHGDTGNTMFIILRGQVGVYIPQQDRQRNIARPSLTLSEGEIVGELAFALRHKRTADLVALGDTALLSFEYEQLRDVLGGRGAMIWEYMNGSALEHVSQRVPFLIGRQLSDLDESARQDWIDRLGTLKSNCRILTTEPNEPFTLNKLRSKELSAANGGVYILTSGVLTSSTSKGKRLDGERLPIVYVDLPGYIVAPDHEFVVEAGPATFLFLGLDAINDLAPDARSTLIHSLKRELHNLYYYDVFMSYNFTDETHVEAWEQSLTEKGLRVFRDMPHRPAQPYATRDLSALLDSLTMLVFVSPTMMVKPAEHNWVEKEMDFRKEHFDHVSLIAPVQLGAGDPQQKKIWYSVVRHPDEVVKLVKAIKDGEQEPPHGWARHVGTQLG